MTDIFNSPVLMVEQPRKFFSVEASYQVFSPDGEPLASVAEIDLSFLMKAARFFFSESSANFPAKLQISAPDGQPLLIVDKPFAFFRPKVKVLGADGTLAGYIASQFKLMGSRFTLLDASDNEVGQVSGDWTGWDFSITDAQGNEVARASKKFAGLTKEMFTTADRYAVEFHQELPEPLRSLVVASSVTIDLVLHQEKSN